MLVLTFPFRPFFLFIATFEVLTLDVSIMTVEISGFRIFRIPFPVIIPVKVTSKLTFLGLLIIVVRRVIIAMFSSHPSLSTFFIQSGPVSILFNVGLTV